MPLLPKFSITLPINRALNAIERVGGYLEATLLMSAWMRHAEERALVLECHHSLHLEGGKFSFAQSKQLLESSAHESNEIEEAKELFNYKRAYESVVRQIESELPLTESLIKQLHRQLLEGISRYRSTPPTLLRRPDSYQTSGESVALLMLELVDYLTSAPDVPPVLLSGIAQFLLMHISPFAEGNAHIARLLSLFLLLHSGYSFLQFISLSEWYDQDREGYYKALNAPYAQDLDLSSWLEYFTRGVAELTHSLYLKISTASQESYKKIALTARQQQIIGFLEKHQQKRVTIQEFEALYPDVNRRTLQRDIFDLKEKGLLSQEGLKKSAYYILHS